MDKVVATVAEAVADARDGMSLAVGGFGLSGVPNELIRAVHARGVRDLSVVSNNCGALESGLALLLAAGRIARVTGSYIGANKEFARQYLAGEIEVELIPQGTLAERLRAGGCGIPAFYTPAGVGTQVADGGLPWRYDGHGGVAVASPPKEVREFDGREYVMERSIRTDFALVRAARGDRHGNLVFAKSSRNFNPLAAMAGRVTVAEVEELVEPGAIDPDEVHLPGVFVQRVVALTPEQAADKRIERRTVSVPGARGPVTV
ncbi:CoA transferase subunit A [Streptomyces paludis]|uniref:CoA transferase subunit A n=1 Tax=Streptomyces paludis TaxID=2282738 RepID=A0A345HZL8_9ACTN|nr:CoA transferase subunit A [Streptomyces paludis]AXG82142.1 CoA transferase subunit A [Streptomyces paludis]